MKKSLVLSVFGFISTFCLTSGEKSAFDRVLNIKKHERMSRESSSRFDRLENSKTVQQIIREVNQIGLQNLTAEYDGICEQEPMGTFDSARFPRNMNKNRYAIEGLLSFDHSRVILSQDENSTDDYINANYVDGYKQKNAFISTQGPLESTAEDFWRMIWDQKCLVIAMTTRLTENKRQKCFQYWKLNAGEDVVHGNVEIKTVSVETSQDFSITLLEISNLRTNETRNLTHFYFTSWPDLGVPSSAKVLLTFIYQVREKQAQMVHDMGDSWTGHPLGPPIVVHCSAGVGRTGTFMTIYNSISRLTDSGNVNVRGIVEKIRSQRAYAVETRDQYVFCYRAIVEYAKEYIPNLL